MTENIRISRNLISLHSLIPHQQSLTPLMRGQLTSIVAYPLALPSGKPVNLIPFQSLQPPNSRGHRGGETWQYFSESFSKEIFPINTTICSHQSCMPYAYDDPRRANRLLPCLLQVLQRFSWNLVLEFDTVGKPLPQLQGEKVCVLTFKKMSTPLGININIGWECHSLNG